MKSVRVELSTNEVGDWEVFCYGPGTMCLLFCCKTYNTRNNALLVIDEHLRHYHLGEILVMVSEPDFNPPPPPPPQGKHSA